MIGCPCGSGLRRHFLIGPIIGSEKLTRACSQCFFKRTGLEAKDVFEGKHDVIRDISSEVEDENQRRWLSIAP